MKNKLLKALSLISLIFGISSCDSSSSSTKGTIVINPTAYLNEVEESYYDKYGMYFKLDDNSTYKVTSTIRVSSDKFGYFNLTGKTNTVVRFEKGSITYAYVNSFYHGYKEITEEVDYFRYMYEFKYKNMEGNLLERCDSNSISFSIDEKNYYFDVSEDEFFRKKLRVSNGFNYGGKLSIFLYESTGCYYLYDSDSFFTRRIFEPILPTECASGWSLQENQLSYSGAAYCGDTTVHNTNEISSTEFVRTEEIKVDNDLNFTSERIRVIGLEMMFIVDCHIEKIDDYHDEFEIDRSLKHSIIDSSARAVIPLV